MSNATKSEYPEHDKMLAVQDQSRAIGEFLEWTQGEGYLLAEYGRNESDYPTRVQLTIEQVMARYFGIDLAVIEKEKRAMLAGLRK
jgi:hypothetical protein